MIEAHQLSKIFSDKKRGEVRAVDSVSFRCAPGEIYGLLGANGAGKTTTLRMLATIFKPSSGTANLAGFDVIREPAKVRAHVGFLSTATALYGRLTTQEMVEYFGRLNGIESQALRKSLDHFIRSAGHELVSRPPLRKTFHGNEAEGVDCADAGA
jgi:sodium transport system ATP-binding protein